MNRAVVVPVEGPIRFVEWQNDGDLLPLLQREIGTDCVDSFRMRGRSGEMTGWVDDEGLLVDAPKVNLRLLQIAHALGYPADALAGTGVITGGATVEGDTLGLNDELVAWFEAAAATRTGVGG